MGDVRFAPRPQQASATPWTGQAGQHCSFGRDFELTEWRVGLWFDQCTTRLSGTPWGWRYNESASGVWFQNLSTSVSSSLGVRTTMTDQGRNLLTLRAVFIWPGGGGSVVRAPDSVIQRSRVRIPAGAAREFSSPGSIFCADSYFGIRFTPVLPQ